MLLVTRSNDVYDVAATVSLLKLQDFRAHQWSTEVTIPVGSICLARDVLRTTL